VKMSNITIRTELNQYIKRNGIKQNYISKKIGLSTTTINLFLHGKRDLALSRLEVIYFLMRNEI